MLVFVNYAHFNKKCRNYASTKFDENTSITICSKQIKGKLIYPIYT